MSALVLDGKKVAAESEAELSLRVEQIKKAGDGAVPILATILVGGDPASATYVKMKGNACKRVGIEPLKVELPEETTTEQLLGKIAELNDDPNVHGILLQHPVWFWSYGNGRRSLWLCNSKRYYAFIRSLQHAAIR